MARKKKPRNVGEVLSDCRMAMMAAIPVHLQYAEACRKLEEFDAQYRDERAPLVKAEMETRQQNNEVFLSLNKYLHELREVDPERGEKFAQALREDNWQGAMRTIE
jgi:cell division protein ZapA (FtsZ GTPase activity inhibitor)